MSHLSTSASSHQSNSNCGISKEKILEQGIKVKGRIRDEYCCPITRQILKDPIIASDGHTYDRREFKRWLASRNISPKTGEELNQVILPNYNIQRLIRDLFEEGGEGLVYPKGHPCAEDEETWLGYENILILQCVGPQENDLYNVSITVYREGLSGGRKRQQNGSRDSVEFKDSTVSRKHFTIDFHEKEDSYTLRDEGSAGGTYIRIPYGQCRPLEVGTMILVGKHQFEVIDESQSENNLINSMGTSTNSSSEMMQLEGETNGAEILNDVTAKLPNDISEITSTLPCPPGSEENPLSNEDHPPNLPQYEKDYNIQENGELNPKLILRCFGPEGSPIQNKEYIVYSQGATVGRKIENNISLSQKNEKDGQTVAIDSAVSGEHCRVIFDEETKQFIILDGTKNKQSTNGTWIRLSKAHQPSMPVLLRNNDEMLVGGVLRFSITVQKFLTEKDASECVDDDITDGETVVGDGSHMVQDEDAGGGTELGLELAGNNGNQSNLERENTTTTGGL